MQSLDNKERKPKVHLTSLGIFVQIPPLVDFPGLTSLVTQVDCLETNFASLAPSLLIS